MPSVPPAAIEAVASESSYLYLRISGIETFDMVAAVASEDPQMAENMPQAAMVDMARPPRRCPRKT